MALPAAPAEADEQVAEARKLDFRNVCPTIRFGGLHVGLAAAYIVSRNKRRAAARSP